MGQAELKIQRYDGVNDNTSNASFRPFGADLVLSGAGFFAYLAAVQGSQGGRDLMISYRSQKMLFSEIPIWVGIDELKPGDLILVDLGRMLGEKRVEYAGVYSEPMSGMRGLLGRLDGKVLPLGSLAIFRRKIKKDERIRE